MKNELYFYAIVLVAMFMLSVSADGQIAAGGSFTLDQTVLAGGGSDSSGGNFKVEGTIGQAAAGARSTGVPFQMQNGFWTAPPLAPTAAGVTISGRVTAANGRGIKKAKMLLTDSAGGTFTAITNTSGYYSFEDVPAGETYIVMVSLKRYIFAPMVLSVYDDIADVDFTANP